MWTKHFILFIFVLSIDLLELSRCQVSLFYSFAVPMHSFVLLCFASFVILMIWPIDLWLLCVALHCVFDFHIEYICVCVCIYVWFIYKHLLLWFFGLGKHRNAIATKFEMHHFQKWSEQTSLKYKGRMNHAKMFEYREMNEPTFISWSIVLKQCICLILVWILWQVLAFPFHMDFSSWFSTKNTNCFLCIFVNLEKAWSIQYLFAAMLDCHQ